MGKSTSHRKLEFGISKKEEKKKESKRGDLWKHTILFNARFLVNVRKRGDRDRRKFEEMKDESIQVQPVIRWWLIRECIPCILYISLYPSFFIPHYFYKP